MYTEFSNEKLFNLNPLCIYMLVKDNNVQYRESFLDLNNDDVASRHGLYHFRAIDVRNPGAFGFAGMEKRLDLYKSLKNIDVIAQDTASFQNKHIRYSAIKIEDFEKDMDRFLSHHSTWLEQDSISLIYLTLSRSNVKDAVFALIDKHCDEYSARELKEVFTNKNITENIRRFYDDQSMIEELTMGIRHYVTEALMNDFFCYIAHHHSQKKQDSESEIRKFFTPIDRPTAITLRNKGNETLPDPLGKVVIMTRYKGRNAYRDIVLMIEGKEIRLDGLNYREKLYYAFVCVCSPEGIKVGAKWNVKDEEGKKMKAIELFYKMWNRNNDYPNGDIRVDINEIYSPQTVSNINRRIRMAMANSHDCSAFYEISHANNKHFVRLPKDRIDTDGIDPEQFMRNPFL